ncbi:hypothetical protein ECHHL_0217 [Ehrlichia chaffeensis str. Heartland]|uniref:hypothetical protein n=1 Tax=Ehrlichia chaffeensis TaxID=945 RepID=UPI000053B5ED|nr:hypothetical protein [Ehrlichia chaffeensis]AHX03383.1 hypothetical protein ECHHL_0217 [Ehrlichia chaffeensis str. Heartland]AHX05896.1 hypothetical protein ECHJAX_0840 [Ehrlichia chaffeensis str. Jax]AHX06888.1 hypothetical protein ECHLIB_0844 [Ehrlichia chaffeensis str. Liberty]AHX10784.1 hypothetical protein ECHWP_0215 [Ehrlichia chaffeensis str. West Paces]
MNNTNITNSTQSNNSTNSDNSVAIYAPIIAITCLLILMIIICRRMHRNRENQVSTTAPSRSTSFEIRRHTNFTNYVLYDSFYEPELTDREVMALVDVDAPHNNTRRHNNSNSTNASGR